MIYPDAAQLCLRLYSTADGVPEVFRSQLSRLGLADTFAELARSGWIRESGAQTTESGHWVEVIASIFKQGAGVVDMARGEVLARQVGFGQERVCDDKKAG
jgi:hypothetical protein